MVVDVVKTNLTIHVETSTDHPFWPDFMAEFAQAVKLIQAAVAASNITRAFCRMQPPAGPGVMWQCNYEFGGLPPRTFIYVTDFAVTPHLVRTPSNDWFTEEERLTVQRIHEEIEHLRNTHDTVLFDWQEL